MWQLFLKQTIPQFYFLSNSGRTLNLVLLINKPHLHLKSSNYLFTLYFTSHMFILALPQQCFFVWFGKLDNLRTSNDKCLRRLLKFLFDCLVLKFIKLINPKWNSWFSRKIFTPNSMEGCHSLMTCAGHR